MATWTDDELRRASHHVRWEILQLLGTSAHLGEICGDEPLTVADPVEAAVLEAFCLHTRALIHFFWHEPRDSKPDDLFAEQWFDAGRSVREPKPAAAQAIDTRIGWGVAHLSFRRVRQEHVWGWRFVEVAAPIVVKCREFVDLAPASRVATSLRDDVPPAIEVWLMDTWASSAGRGRLGTPPGSDLVIDSVTRGLKGSVASAGPSPGMHLDGLIGS